MNNSNIEICKAKFHDLKTKSGSHSPSIKSILKEIPEIKLDTDACFLSNPYATDLFLKYLKSDYPTYDDLRDVLEFYPPQNAEIAKSISSTLNLSPKNVFVGNVLNYSLIQIHQKLEKLLIKKGELNYLKA